MAIRIIYAEPGPEAEAAQRRRWVLAYEIADARLARMLAAKSKATATTTETGPKTLTGDDVTDGEQGPGASNAVP